MSGKAFESAFVYLLGIVLLSVYGIEVCPFLESMGAVRLAEILLVAAVAGFAFRSLLVRRVEQKEKRSGAIDVQIPWRFLQIDMASWMLVGLLVAAWNAVNYDFPLSSGLKVLLGCLTLGIFTSTCLALDAEYQLIRLLSEAPLRTIRKEGRFLSITTKFLVFISSCVGIVALILLLLIYKDFQFIVQRLSSGRVFSFAGVVGEVLFVFAVLLGGTFAVVRKYSRNLKRMFDLQLSALEEVARGDYDAFVPVVSRDEFSAIAEQTNSMIVGLKEKERIRRIFGKYVSDPVAREILDQERGDDLGGREVRVAVLFTDLRGFTPLSERCSPSEVVRILNQYFTMVVRSIHRRRGVLDKFIGDAAMAVFGLGGGGRPCDDALDAAFDIRRKLAGLNEHLAESGLPLLENGIGIHYGVVVAGNIGSPERMEYTVVGDAVNTAARLEQLTKELPSEIALSETVYQELATDVRLQLRLLGEYALKGKSAPVRVYGPSGGPDGGR